MSRAKLKESNASMDKIIIKIGGKTNHISAATSIKKHLLNGDKVYVDVIGMAANYACTKAFIHLRSGLAAEGMIVLFSPTYKDLETTDHHIKTAVRWKVVCIKKPEDSPGSSD
jgi:stage V sporulation protein SpoVS